MPIEELKKDADEFAKLLGEATRSRVKNALTYAKAEVEKEIVNLEMKAKLAEERKAAAEKGVSKRYVSQLNEYAWDQSDKFVKLFVTLEGVQDIDEKNVKIEFTDRSMQLTVSDLKNKDYGLSISHLLDAIDPSKSYRKIKTGMVAIYMKKVIEGKSWEHLNTMQQRHKQKQVPDMDMKTEDPSENLVNIIKKMYDTGDSKTKQMIAKVWTESQQGHRNPDVSDMASMLG